MKHYEQKLIDERKKLTEELGHIGKRDNDSGQWQVGSENSEDSADDNINADRFEEFEEKSSLVIPLEKRLSEVDAALRRIENGTFGQCSVCHGMIESDRLDANPAAETCIKHLK